MGPSLAWLGRSLASLVRPLWLAALTLRSLSSSGSRAFRELARLVRELPCLDAGEALRRHIMGGADDIVRTWRVRRPTSGFR